MRIAIYVGTGVVGSAVVRLAIERGHDVRLLVRSRERAADAADEVVVGDVPDPDAVAKTLGSAAVFSALGGFADARSIETRTANIMAAMREAGVRRQVVMQGFHISFPEDPRNPGARLFDTMLRVRSPRSHRLGELLRGCHDLDWTLVRAPLSDHVRRLGTSSTAFSIWAPAAASPAAIWPRPC